MFIFILLVATQHRTSQNDEQTHTSIQAGLRSVPEEQIKHLTTEPKSEPASLHLCFTDR